MYNVPLGYGEHHNSKGTKTEFVLKVRHQQYMVYGAYKIMIEISVRVRGIR
jgi:hypothetical protein